MHKPESLLKNETHKIFYDLEIPTDYLILARRPDLVMIHKKNTRKKKQKKKKNLPSGDFAFLADHRVKIKEREKKNKYLDLARELRKQRNIKVTV